MRIIFLDTETTGLDPTIHEIWEVGCIVRELVQQTDMTYVQEEEDVEHRWFLPMFNFQHADPFALDIGKFWGRYVWPDAKKYDDMGEWCRMFCQLTKDAIIVGAVPNFDVERLDILLHKYGYRMFHQYHLVDIENLIAGRLGIHPPWKSSDLSELMGIKINEEDRHSALGDARWARNCYDAVMKL